MTGHDRPSHAAPHPVAALIDPPLPWGKARDPVCGMALSSDSVIGNALRLRIVRRN